MENEQKQNDTFLSVDKKPTANIWKIIAIVVIAMSAVEVAVKFINFTSAVGSDVAPLWAAVVSFLGILIPCGAVILLTQILDELKKLNDTKKAQFDEELSYQQNKKRDVRDND